MAIKAAIPENEEQRIKELQRYQILDSMPEKAFDDLARIAASICNTPVSIVSLVDKDRQWFKASSGGTGITETSRDIAFCAHTILDSSTMVVPDAQKDERFANNPLVTGEQSIRFYAGAPLITPSGMAVGALCAIDQKPGELSAEQRESLEALARQVVDQMEMRVHIRKLEEQAIELEHNRENALRKILETMQSGLIVINAQGRIERSNSSIHTMLGYTALELSELDPKKLFKSDNVILQGQPEGCQLTRGGVQQETELITKCAKVVPVLLSASILSSKDGIFQGWVCVAHDLSTTKAMQAQLLSAQKLEAIGRLAAGISHEINTPIQFIGDNTRFLLDAFKDFLSAMEFVKQCAEGSAEAIEQIKDRAAMVLKDLDLEFLSQEAPRAIEQTLEGVGRVSRIVRAMKEFSHPGSDQKQLVSLNRLIESTITVSSNEWKYVAQVETDFEPDLPLVPCLPGEFNQVILNMLVNAAHALESTLSQGKRDKGLIKISTRRSGDYAIVSIEDNGSGIPRQIVNKIFEPFFTTKEVGKGTGQGLAIARSVVVDKHAGQIEVDSKEGIGTTFRILLPLKHSDCLTQAESASKNSGVNL